MDEQKRLILAIVLSVLVLVGYQAFFVKPPDPETLPQTTSEQSTVQKTANAPSNVSSFSTESQPATTPVVTPASSRTITVDTPLYRVKISEIGAAIRSFELKTYQETSLSDSQMKQMVSEKLRNGTLTFDLKNKSIPDLKNAVYSAQVQTDKSVLTQGKQSFEFLYQASEDIFIKKILTFDANSYLINCDIVIQNGSGMPLNDAIVFTMPGYYDEATKKSARFSFVGPLALINDEHTTIDPDDIEDQNTFTGKIDWAGYTDRYFLTAIMSRPGVSTEGASLFLTYTENIVSNNYIYPMDSLAAGTQGKYPFTFYLGPKSMKTLGSYDNKLKEAINFGFFDMLAKPLLMGMNMIHDFIPNYGIAIILLTIIIKLVFWPLGTKSYKSMNAMKKLQPLMMELREKHKDDKQRMNQEIMGLYKTYKVNPASGCLPLLVQMPFFFALYRMLYQAIELRHAPFLGWITDLSAPERLFNFDFSIPMMQAPYGIPMLTILMGASFLLQQKMTPTAGDPMQAKMMMLMPIFMTVIFINFPAGLVLYMFVNNIISMGQQFYIQKKFS